MPTQAGTRGFISTLGEIGPWILGGVALVQVWVIALWKKLRPGQVEIHGSGSLEIGHSSYGPTVGLRGTLDALHRPAFVERIHVEVVREKDGARHEFAWKVIRPNKLKLTGDAIEEIELPSSFLLRPENPYRFNILFNDEDFVAELSLLVNPLAGMWHEFGEKRLPTTSVRSVTFARCPYRFSIMAMDWWTSSRATCQSDTGAPCSSV